VSEYIGTRVRTADEDSGREYFEFYERIEFDDEARLQ
jgi:hypothetical protein